LQPYPQFQPAQQQTSATITAAATPNALRIVGPDVDLPAALSADAGVDVNGADESNTAETRLYERDAPLAVAVIAVLQHNGGRIGLPRASMVAAVPVARSSETVVVQPEPAMQSRRQGVERRLVDVTATIVPMSLLDMPAAAVAPMAVQQPAAAPVATRLPPTHLMQAVAVTPLVPAGSTSVSDLPHTTVPAQVRGTATMTIDQSSISVIGDETLAKAITPGPPTQPTAPNAVAVSTAGNRTVAARGVPSARGADPLPLPEAVVGRVAQTLPPQPDGPVTQSLPLHHDELTAQRQLMPRRVQSQLADVALAPPTTQPPDVLEPAVAPQRTARVPVAREPTQVETAALGNVTIALDRRDAALHVHFTVDRASTAHALLDSARLLDGALQAGGARLDQLSVDVRGGDVRSVAVTGSDARSPAPQSDGSGQRQPPRDPRTQEAPRTFQSASPPRNLQNAAHDRFA
jgi:hypothetical protein